MTANRFDSVLLVAFGGPTRADEIRPFLANVTRGRPIPPERLEEVAHHYELIGGSPFNRLTFQQADALSAQLGRSLPVFVGMRNWHPLLRETLSEMKERRLRRTVGIILSAQQSEAGWDRYVQDVAGARREVGDGAPEVVLAPPWPDHPLYVEAVADRLRVALSTVAGDAHVLFTAHSIPASMAAGSPYEAQILDAARRVIEAINGRPPAPGPRPLPWSLAYQSRSGNPRDPWLEPDVNDALRDLGAAGVRRVVVMPIGFVCDHVEVLYDIGVEAMATAAACGLELVRAATVNDHPAFIRMLADLVRATMAREGA